MATTANFRQIGKSSGRDKNDRLFTAAVSAYCSITRPTRNDAHQLEKLVLPLIKHASPESRRYACAALSETKLVSRPLAIALCDDKAELCAPLLMNADCFQESDLISLLGRHGVPHAKIIARRKILHPVIRDLLIALGDQTVSDILNKRVTEGTNDKHVAKAPERSIAKGMREEAVREHLRSIMAASKYHDDTSMGTKPSEALAKLIARLRSTALSDNPAFFQTALADALNINFPLARSITETDSHERLTIALRALEVPDSEAYLLTSALFPSVSHGPEAIEGFLKDFNELDEISAQDKIHAWKAGVFCDLMAAKSGALSERPEKPKTAANGSSASQIREAS